MTIEELIKELQQYDPKLPVLLSGYEGGVYLPNRMRKVNVALNVNKEWYYGPHEIVWEGLYDYPDNEKMNGLLIS